MGFQKCSCIRAVSSLVAMAFTCIWWHIAHRSSLTKQTIWQENQPGKNPAISSPWLLVPAPQLCQHRGLQSPCKPDDQSASVYKTAFQSQWLNWRTVSSSVSTEQKGNIFSWFSTESVMLNLTHRQRGILTQDLYIRDECFNQRTSDENPLNSCIGKE